MTHAQPVAERPSLHGLTRLLPYIRPHGLWVALSLINAVVDAGLRVLQPFLLQSMIDSAVAGGVQAFTRWLPVAGAAVVTQMGFTWMGRNANARAIARTIRDLREHVARQLQGLPMAYLDAHHSGDLISRLNSDIAKVEQGLAIVPDLLFQSLLFVAGVIYMLIISRQLLLVSSLLIPATSFIIQPREPTDRARRAPGPRRPLREVAPDPCAAAELA